MKPEFIKTLAELTAAFRVIKQGMEGGAFFLLTFKEQKETRRIVQNSRMWAMLADISKQVDWYAHKLTSDEWKDVFTSALKRLKVVPGIDGGFVVVGSRTSNMTIAEMSEMIEFMFAFGAEKEVRWSDPTLIENSVE